MLILAAAAVPLGIGAHTSTNQAPPRTYSTRLLGAAGQAPLFTATGLTPGNAVSRCVRVGFDATVRGNGVRLAATDVTGPLAPFLLVTVAQGNGTQLPSCTDFTGTPVYAGTLAGLQDTGVTVPWQPAVAASSVHRITVAVRDDNEAQGLTVGANFRWSVLPNPTGGSSPSASVTPTTAERPSRPADSASATPIKPSAAPVPGSTNPVKRPTGPADTNPVSATRTPKVPGITPTNSADRPGGAPTVSASGAAPDSGSSPGAGSSSPRRVTDSSGVDAAFARFGSAMRQAADHAFNLAAAVARRPGFPLFVVFTMFLFLLLQRRFDERDPKLALAPVWADPYLRFSEDDLIVGRPPPESRCDRSDRK